MRKNSRGRGHWQYAFAITTLIDNMFTYYKIYMCVSITKTCSRMTALTAMTGSNTERSKGRPMPFRLSTSTSRCFSRFHHHRKLLVNTIPIYPIHSYISPLVSMFVRPRSHSLRNQSGIRTSDIHTLLHGYMAAWLHGVYLLWLWSAIDPFFLLRCIFLRALPHSRCADSLIARRTCTRPSCWRVCFGIGRGVNTLRIYSNALQCAMHETNCWFLMLF